MARTTFVLLFALSLLPSVADADEKLNYQDHIKPIFRAKCLSCHNTNKKTADLDLSNYTAMMQGGGSGAAIEPGSADDSYLFMLVNHDSEPYMPPNSDRIADEMVDTLRKWIDAGAPETSSSKVMLPKKPQVDLSVDISAGSRPAGDPPMPDVLTLEPVVHTPATTAISAIATSPWARLIAVAGQKQVVLYHSQSLQPLGVLPFPEGQAKVLKFSRNGALLLAGGGHGAASGVAVVWNIKTGQRIIEVGEELDEVLAADISADQSLVALGGPGKIVRVYNTSTGQLAYEITKHTDWITSLEFSPDSVLLATGDRVGGLHVWEAYTGRQYLTLNGHKKAISGTSWRIDSNVLASSSEDVTVKLWEMENGKSIKSWNAHGGGTTAMEFCRDGRVVTCGRDKTAKIWDQNGKQLRAFESFSDLALQVSHCDETDRVIAGDWNGEIRVWQAADGKRIGLLSTNPPPLASRISNAETRLKTQQTAFTQLQQKLQTTQQQLVDHGKKLKQAQTTVTQQTQLQQVEQAKLNSIQNKITSLTQKIVRSTERRKKLQAAIPDLQKALQQSTAAAKLMATDQSLKDVVTKLTQQIATSQKNVETETVSISEGQKTRAEFQKSLAAIQKQLTTVNQDLQTAKKSEAELQKSGKPINENVAKLQQQANAAEQILAATKAEVTRWQDYAALNVALNKLQETNSQHDQLQLAFLEAEAALKTMQEQLNKQQRDLTSHQQQIQQQQTTIEKAKQAMAAGEARKAAMVVTVQQHQQAVPALKSAVDRANAALALLPDDKGMQSTVGALQTTYSQKAAALTSLNKQVSAEDAKLKELNAQVADASTAMNKHQQQAETVKATIASTAEQIGPLAQKAASEKQALDTFTPQLTAAQQLVERQRQKLRPQVQLTSN